MGILCTPLGIKHAPVNPPGRINLPGTEDIPVQIQSGPSMGILGIPLGIKHAPANPPGPINLPGQEDIPVQIQADPPMAFWVRHWVSNMLQLIPQVRSICPAQKLYLCKSKWIPQWVFLGGQWGCDMLLRRISWKPRHRTWSIR